MNSNKPLASLIVCFYNQVDFVEDAVQGALSQTYENLEIVLSDDCSTDGTYEKIIGLIKDYNGSHHIVTNRNNKNLGLVPHFNKVFLELSHGQYIFVQGGDDISLPNRVSIGIDYFIRDSSIYAITCALIFIDRNGYETGRMNLQEDIVTTIQDKHYLSSNSFMCGSGMLASRRDIWNVFGSLNDNSQTEDSCMRFRALLLGKVLASAKYGVKYRIHGNNISIGSVVYKLKSHPIAEQYRKDLTVVKNQIPYYLYKMLQKKIDYYEKNRDVEAKLATISCSIMKRRFWNMKMKYYRFTYQRHLSRLYDKLETEIQ